MTLYNEQMREQLREDIQGEVIEDLRYVEEGDYFILVFTDGFEIPFRFMSDIDPPQFYEGELK